MARKEAAAEGATTTLLLLLVPLVLLLLVLLLLVPLVLLLLVPLMWVLSVQAAARLAARRAQARCTRCSGGGPSRLERRHSPQTISTAQTAKIRSVGGSESAAASLIMGSGGPWTTCSKSVVDVRTTSRLNLETTKQRTTSSDSSQRQYAHCSRCVANSNAKKITGVCTGMLLIVSPPCVSRLTTVARQDLSCTRFTHTRPHTAELGSSPRVTVLLDRG
jgi:hypothetical protein